MADAHIKQGSRVTNITVSRKYFWDNVLKMDDAKKDMIESINIKIIEGLKKS